MGRSCLVWCCYEDPYDRQCGKIVKKSNNMVRCKRIGNYHIKEKNKYYCEKHYYEYMNDDNKKQSVKRVSVEISEGSISD